MSEPFDDLLNQTFYGMDVTAVLSGIEDFLEFSEKNLSWQREREMRRARQEAEETRLEGEDAKYETDLKLHIIDNAAYRFDVILTQRIRYAALTALTTSLEWAVYSLGNNAATEIRGKPRTVNKAIHILQTLNSRGQFGLDEKIEQIEKIIHVRNCVVHGAGLIDSHDHPDQLRESIAAIEGMRLGKKNFLGESVEIDAGVIESCLAEAMQWIPDLERKCIENGIVIYRRS